MRNIAHKKVNELVRTSGCLSRRRKEKRTEMYILMKNGETVIPFTEAKKYDTDNRYIALHGKDTNCFLCRYLGEEEAEFFERPHYLYDCTNEPLTTESANRIGNAVMIITEDAKDFGEADKLIESINIARSDLLNHLDKLIWRERVKAGRISVLKTI